LPIDEIAAESALGFKEKGAAGLGAAGPGMFTEVIAGLPKDRRVNSRPANTPQYCPSTSSGRT